MEELCENAVVHNIQITYHMPNEILKHRINYKYMAIETDKHVKIMFDKLERIPEVTNIELYIQLEPCAEVRIEEIQQTTTSLQVTVLDAQYKYSTHVEDNMFMPMVMMMTTMMMTTTMLTRLLLLTMMMTMMMRTTMLMRILPLTVKILPIEMSMKARLTEGTFGTLRTLRGTLMTMRHWMVMNLMQIMLLVSKTLRTQSLPMHVLRCHSLQILRKIWLILHILRCHLCLLGERG